MKETRHGHKIMKLKDLTNHRKELVITAKNKEFEKEAKSSHRRIIFGDYPDQLV